MPETENHGKTYILWEMVSKKLNDTMWMTDFNLIISIMGLMLWKNHNDFMWIEFFDRNEVTSCEIE